MSNRSWRPYRPLATFREIQADESRAANRHRLEGWPIMQGTAEERAQRHLVALLEAQLAEHRRNRGLA